MRTTFDFTPLSRSSVGFDRILAALEAASRRNGTDSWPPYDIARVDEDSYRITMAVAGFRESDLTLTQNGNVLIVTGRKEGDEKAQYLHRGIPADSFERRFELADYVRVEGASLVDGLLEVSLKREIPEEKKPRRIEIAQASKAGADTPRLTTTQASQKQPEPVAA